MTTLNIFSFPESAVLLAKKSFQFQKTFFQGSSPTSDSSCLFARSFQGTAASVQKSEVTTINLKTFFSCNPFFFDDSGVANGRMMVAKGLTANKKGGGMTNLLEIVGFFLQKCQKNRGSTAANRFCFIPRVQNEGTIVNRRMREHIKPPPPPKKKESKASTKNP